MTAGARTIDALSLERQKDLPVNEENDVTKRLRMPSLCIHKS